jgi:hypothetical protein
MLNTRSSAAKDWQDAALDSSVERQASPPQPGVMLPRIFPLAFAIAAPRRAAACASSLRLRRLTACAQRPPPPTDVDATAAPAKAPETPAEVAGFRIVRGAFFAAVFAPNGRMCRRCCHAAFSLHRS